MTKLTFPMVVDFIEYLIKHDIKRMGIAPIHQVDHTQKDMALYIEKFVLSAIRYLDAKSISKELLICEIPYYRSLYVTLKHNTEEAREPKEKALKQLMKEIDDICRDFDYKLEILNCKFDD